MDQGNSLLNKKLLLRSITLIKNKKSQKYFHYNLKSNKYLKIVKKETLNLVN